MIKTNVIKKKNEKQEYLHLQNQQIVDLEPKG